METKKTKNNTNPIENVALVKKLLMIVCGFMLAGIVVLLLGAMLANFILGSPIIALFFIGGYAIFASPTFLTFIFKAGPFVDVGPIFMESDTVVGNIIYRRMVRQHFLENMSNIALTMFKWIFLAVASIIITPIIAIVLFAFYKVQRKKSVKYANENGIDKNSIPAINKTLVIVAICIIVGMFVGLIVCEKIGDAVDDAKLNAQLGEYSETFEAIINNPVEEYYAETCYFASGDGIYDAKSTQGFAAEFTINGKRVLAGDISYNDTGIEGLDNNSKYFIIDDVVYLSTGGAYLVTDNEEIITLLPKRHMKNSVSKSDKLSDVTERDEYTILEYERGKDSSNYFSLYVDSEGELLFYSTPELAGEWLFKLTDNSLDGLKAEAKALIK